MFRSKCGSKPHLKLSSRKATHKKVRDLGATLKCAHHKCLLNYTLGHKPLVVTIMAGTEKKTYVRSF